MSEERQPNDKRVKGNKKRIKRPHANKFTYSRYLRIQ